MISLSLAFRRIVVLAVLAICLGQAATVVPCVDNFNNMVNDDLLLENCDAPAAGIPFVINPSVTTQHTITVVNSDISYILLLCPASFAACNDGTFHVAPLLVVSNTKLSTLFLGLDGHPSAWDNFSLTFSDVTYPNIATLIRLDHVRARNARFSLTDVSFAGCYSVLRVYDGECHQCDFFISNLLVGQLNRYIVEISSSAITDSNITVDGSDAFTAEFAGIAAGSGDYLGVVGLVESATAERMSVSIQNFAAPFTVGSVLLPFATVVAVTAGCSWSGGSLTIEDVDALTIRGGSVQGSVIHIGGTVASVELRIIDSVVTVSAGAAATESECSVLDFRVPASDITVTLLGSTSLTAASGSQKDSDFAVLRGGMGVSVAQLHIVIHTGSQLTLAAAAGRSASVVSLGDGAALTDVLLHFDGSAVASQSIVHFSGLTIGTVTNVTALLTNGAEFVGPTPAFTGSLLSSRECAAGPGRSIGGIFIRVLQSSVIHAALLRCEDGSATPVTSRFEAVKVHINESTLVIPWLSNAALLDGVEVMIGSSSVSASAGTPNPPPALLVALSQNPVVSTSLIIEHTTITGFPRMVSSLAAPPLASSTLTAHFRCVHLGYEELVSAARGRSFFDEVSLELLFITPCRTPSETLTESETPTVSPSLPLTSTPSTSLTRTRSTSRTSTSSPSATATRSVSGGSPTKSATASNTIPPTRSVSSTASRSRTSSFSPTLSRSPPPTPSRSATVVPSLTSVPTASVTPTPSRGTPSGSATHSHSSSAGTPSRTTTLSVTASVPPTRTASASGTKSLTSSASVTASVTPPPTATRVPTPTVTQTVTPTQPPTRTRTVSPSFASPTGTFHSDTLQRTPSPTSTLSASRSVTASAPQTPTTSLSNTGRSRTHESTRTKEATPTWHAGMLPTVRPLPPPAPRGPGRGNLTLDEKLAIVEQLFGLPRNSTGALELVWELDETDFFLQFEGGSGVPGPSTVQSGDEADERRRRGSLELGPAHVLPERALAIGQHLGTMALLLGSPLVGLPDPTLALSRARLALVHGAAHCGGAAGDNDGGTALHGPLQWGGIFYIMSVADDDGDGIAERFDRGVLVASLVLLGASLLFAIAAVMALFLIRRHHLRARQKRRYEAGKRGRALLIPSTQTLLKDATADVHLPGALVVAAAVITQPCVSASVRLLFRATSGASAMRNSNAALAVASLVVLLAGVLVPMMIIVVKHRQWFQASGEEHASAKCGSGLAALSGFFGPRSSGAHRWMATSNGAARHRTRHFTMWFFVIANWRLPWFTLLEMCVAAIAGALEGVFASVAGRETCIANVAVTVVAIPAALCVTVIATRAPLTRWQATHHICSAFVCAAGGILVGVDFLSSHKDTATAAALWLSLAAVMGIVVLPTLLLMFLRGWWLWQNRRQLWGFISLRQPFLAEHFHAISSKRMRIDTASSPAADKLRRRSRAGGRDAPIDVPPTATLAQDATHFDDINSLNDVEEVFPEDVWGTSASDDEVDVETDEKACPPYSSDSLPLVVAITPSSDSEELELMVSPLDEHLDAAHATLGPFHANEPIQIACQPTMRHPRQTGTVADLFEDISPEAWRAYAQRSGIPL